MRVFILGGQNQTYLAYQVDAIREHIVAYEDIVYVTGPVHESRTLAASTEHVEPSVPLSLLRLPNEDIRPQLKFFRIEATINLICEKYLTDIECGLFLHGDCIPVATMTEEILLDRHLSACCHGHGPKWCLTRKGIGHDVMKRRNVKRWTMSAMTLDGFEVHLVQPGFIHADDLATDDDETTTAKLAAMKRAYPARANEAVSSSS